MLKIWKPQMSKVVWRGAAASLVLALILAAAVSGPVYAQDGQNVPRSELPDGRPIPQGARQILRDDLNVAGEVIDDDVIVYSGDVELDDGGRITGDLIVFSGNIDIDEASGVDGDVMAYSGDVSVAGFVGGDLSNLSGNVELASSARIDGDISVVNGSLEREDGATVSGNVVRGPRFGFGDPMFEGDGPREPRGVSFDRSNGSGFFGAILGFIGRLFVAALLTAFAMLLVGGLFYMRPQWIADTRRRMNEQLALSAVLGVLANLVLLFLAGLLAVTICLLPLALLPMLGLLAINVVGWAVASQVVGERIVSATRQQAQPVLAILTGALVLTSICALLWAIGSCFRPLAFLLVLAISSLGTGAVLAPWVNKRRGGETGGGDVPPGGPVGPAPSGPVPSAHAPVETDVAAPIDYVTAEEVNLSGDRGRAFDSTTAESSELEEESIAYQGTADTVVESDVAAPIDYVTAEEINTTQEQKPAAPAKPRTRGARKAAGEQSASASAPGDEQVELDVAAPIDYVTAQEVVTSETVSEGDDFLRIKGIGPTFARRLKDAGYHTFAQLAAASPEEVAAAIGWPVDRVRRNEVVDQAQMLARQGRQG